ncbi:ATP-dependent DNA helicase RecQ [Pontibacillus sp. HMF3514]|uniref:RecQ family ATP-dependent DNA helicase n=1 Tax=Pontibacillus sp. HMF3514 TaxID=2692425 RepID=UPI00131FBA74|nr:RecQ family ATP-dependent DNA helicase [Pontibacillus sp. HMF3514]QHE52553.1 RecQ family ATP-dependent DNA helicase [Pontibacillus sp. HMF3514]
MNTLRLEDHLQRAFGYTSFREGQKEIIEDLMKGEDVLGILPTGTGKSMCYQLPSILMEGTVIVVSPLISLMVDQVKQLKQQGYKQVTAINSFLDFQQKKDIMTRLSAYQLIYCSPEMLQNNYFLQQLEEQVNVSLFVIDEAHCISQWGHEFRPDYLKLDRVLRRLGEPRVLALSATAPMVVQQDIMVQIGRPNMKKHIYPMDRENIAFAIEHLDSMQDKLERMKQVLSEGRVPAMIYFTSRQWTEKAAYELSHALSDLRIAFYHGGMEQTDRLLIQQQFMNNQLDVICCTSAFGMGVNKPDIRLIIHAHIPSQVESFLQEIGRAGRDGKQSVSLTLYAPGDGEIPRKLFESELPDEHTIQKVMNYLAYLANENKFLPLQDSEVESFLEINEIHWRFLKYQFEKHDMIDGRSILYDENEWNKAFQHIQAFIEERMNLKQQKLSRLLHWVHQNECRRTYLYEPFQSSLKEPTGFCCDYCDFRFDKWFVKHQTPAPETLNWEMELKRIFVQGDYNEVDKPS